MITTKYALHVKHFKSQICMEFDSAQYSTNTHIAQMMVVNSLGDLNGGCGDVNSGSGSVGEG